jgi:hypothetical protein
MKNLERKLNTHRWLKLEIKRKKDTGCVLILSDLVDNLDNLEQDMLRAVPASIDYEISKALSRKEYMDVFDDDVIDEDLFKEAVMSASKKILALVRRGWDKLLKAMENATKPK